MLTVTTLHFPHSFLDSVQRDVPVHGINKEYPSLLTLSRPTQPLCVPRDWGQLHSILHKCISPHSAPSLGCLRPSASWSWLTGSHHLSPPTFLPLLLPLQKASRWTFKWDRGVWKLPLAPASQTVEEEGKVSKGGGGDYMVRESGSWKHSLGRVWLWGKRLLPFMLNCE